MDLIDISPLKTEFIYLKPFFKACTTDIRMIDADIRKNIYFN